MESMISHVIRSIEDGVEDDVREELYDHDLSVYE